MNKLIIRYFLIFLAAGAILVYLFKGRTPFGKDNSSFAVDTETEITRIDFFQGDKRLSLEKTGEGWLINKKDAARKNAIIFILRTLKEIKIKSPVSVENFDNVIIKKNIDPVKVNIYSKRKLLKSFFVYKTGSNIYGNIMKLKASSKPFIVYIPGYEDNIGTHFNLNDLFWKSYMVFNLLPSQIASVKFENSSDSSFSFIINCNKMEYSLSDFRRAISGWDTLKVRRYLTYYTAIPFETWAFDLPATEKRIIESGPALYRITVKQSNGEENTLTIWEKWNFINGDKKRDTDRVWAKTNLLDEIFIMRYFDLDPILKKRSYFLTE
ncbi:MAG: hypothetical protein C0408_04775 [Odoribacter sp.]|nr:hypothetical protein [Odoribacter sp.]